MKELQGTAKQIAWAEDIRSGYLAKAERLEAIAKRLSDDTYTVETVTAEAPAWLSSNAGPTTRRVRVYEEEETDQDRMQLFAARAIVNADRKSQSLPFSYTPIMGMDLDPSMEPWERRPYIAGQYSELAQSIRDYAEREGSAEAWIDAR